jgi:anaerobic selenocysteine-containing dehydrogenase
LSGIRPGVVFVPFHYGYWDAKAGHHDRAANELTPTSWDPVSKQPLFKSAAVRLVRESAGVGSAPAPQLGGSAPAASTETE